MATTPTQLPVPSEKPQDLKFNAGKIDEFVTSMGWTYTDRFGNKHYTIEGINYLAQQVMSAFGYVTLAGVTFTTGATISNPNEVLFNTADSSYYKWTGSFASGPKVVPENSTPESTGGVGPGKWMNVGDAMLRSDLASGGQADLVGYETPYNNDQITVREALDIKYPNIIGNVDAPATGFIFNSFEHYSGNHDIRLTDHGSIVKSTKRIKKTGHATITLDGSIDGLPPLTVDTIAYVDPTSFEGGFPQEIAIDGITFEGDDDGLTEVGLTIHEGQRFQLKNVAFLKVKKAMQFNSWVTQLDFIMANGQIHQTGGTSTTYNNVGAWVNDPSVLPGAFRLENLQYSNLRCCTSDGTVRTAYYINNCNGLTMTSCACELPAATDIGMGVAMHFQEGNDSTITDFVCIPKNNEQNPITSFNRNNNITLNNALFSWGNAYPWDLYINGPNNHIVLNLGAFGGAGAGNLGLPTVGANSEAVGSTILYVSKTNKYMARVTSAQNILQFEPFIEERSIDNEVALTFGDSAEGIAVTTMDCKYHKNGNVVRVDFIVQLNGAGGQTGSLRIRNLPWQAKDGASGVISTYSYLSGGVGPISLNIARGSNALEFLKLSSIGTTALTSDDLTATSLISGSITYSIDSNFNY